MERASIAAAIEVLGDRWSLHILSDVIFGDLRYFRALLTGSSQGIASNILADRLVRLVEAGLLTRGTAARGARARYSLTEAGIQTFPVLWALGEWGAEWRTGDAPAEAAADVAQLMADLRARHLTPS